MFCVSFNGLGRLHFTHLVIPVVCGLNIMVVSSKLGSFEKTQYPDTLDVQLDYARFHRFALPVVVMNGVVALMALTTFSLNVATKTAFRLVLEISWTGLAVMIYIANIVLVGLGFPSHLFSVRGGESQSLPGPDGKLSIEDTAALFRADWLIAVSMHGFLLIILLAHTGWHIAVAARHRTIRPNVWLEPISGSYAWNLPPAAQPQFEYPIVLSDGFKGLGSERTKEWIYTPDPLKRSATPMV